MRAAKLVAPRQIELVDIEEPVPTDTGLVVDVQSVSLCGSDLLAYQGLSARYGFPRIPGHEVSGIVSAVGNAVDNWEAGARVVIDPNIACGECMPCTEGLVQLCDVRLMLGENMSAIGGCSEKVTIPARNAHRLPGDMSFLIASLIQPLAISYHALSHRARLERGETAVVIGGGAVGLGCALIGMAQGANLAIVEPHHSRRQFASDLGVPLVVEPSPSGYDSVMEWTGGRGADVVVEAVGGDQLDTARDALGLAGRRGRVVILGEFASPEVPLLVRDLKKREVEILGSVGHPDSFEPVIDLLKSGRFDPRGLVTHVVPLEEVLYAFDLLESRADGVLKVAVNMA